MRQIHTGAEPLSAVSQRVREREILRQLHYNNTRKAALRSRTAARNYAASRAPALAREFLETLLGSLLGFGIIAELLTHLAGVSELYTFSVFGLIYSLQSTYYKYKLGVDPGFKIPSCRCARGGMDGTKDVLQSRQSAVLGIPNSVFASAFFCSVLVLTAVADTRTALPLACMAIAASIYLSYVMIVRIRHLCATCINMTALSALILWQLLA